MKVPDLADRRIEYLPLDDIQPAPRNPKAHDLNSVRASISRFGFATPALRDERTGRLVAGHGRHDALREMRDAGEQPPTGVRLAKDGGWLVPVVCGWASRSDQEAEAYLVADNRHPELGGWDDAGLAELLSDLAEFDPALLEVTGYSQGDLEVLLEGLDNRTNLPPALDDPDRIPEAPKEPVTRPGDVWNLGPHRIICGDCRDFSTVEVLLAGQRINVAFTSPPYASQRAYDESSGFKPIQPGEYTEWFRDVQANVRAVLADDGSWFVNIKEHCEDGQRHLYVKDLTIAHVREWGWRFVDELCWTHSGLPGSWDNRHKNQFEPIFHFSGSRHIKFRPGANGKESDEVFTYTGDLQQAATGNPISWSGSSVTTTTGIALPGNVLRIGKSHEANRHEAAFPVALPAWFIRAFSDDGDTVFDPFMGSGTTLIAAHQEGRIGYGCEISPTYCDLIAARWQQATGEKPVLASTGEPHDFLTGTSNG